MNNFGDKRRRLEWKATKLSVEEVFLDLTLKIQGDGTICSKTYIKPMNLHLYIPAHSAHPPGLMKSLVFGQVQRYWKQNSCITDFEDVTRSFYEHLLNRGYQKQILNECFLDAANKLDNEEKKPRTPSPFDQSEYSTVKNDHDDLVFFHVQYHPDLISKQTIRNCFDATCAPILSPIRGKNGLNELGIRRFIVAYSRAPNFRDKLCSSKLPDYPDHNVSDVLETIPT
jgi:hypothetical protein